MDPPIDIGEHPLPFQIGSIMRNATVIVLSLLVLRPAYADVTASSANGFISQHEFTIAAAREKVFHALTAEVDHWWDAVHSYSGDAANFSIDARAGGCFCEKLKDGDVTHMTVVFVARNKQLRMLGGLGPLQGMAVNGSMTFSLSDEGAGTRLSYTYAVGGYTPDGLDKLAEPVDRVQLGQLQRLQRYVETGNPAAQPAAAPSGNP